MKKINFFKIAATVVVLTTSFVLSGCSNYVDLGLPSGTKWCSQNASGGFYTWDEAVEKFGDNLPTIEQFVELKEECQWEWDSGKKGYTVTGPNGKSIFLPAEGGHDCDGRIFHVGSWGYYWSSTPNGWDGAWYRYFYSDCITIDHCYRCSGASVRLIQY